MSEQVVIARVGNTEYGIDIGAVIEILPYAEPTPIPGAPMNVLGLLRVRERTVPIVELASALGEYPTRGPDSRIVIISLPESHVGFVVDDVVEVFTIPEEALHETPSALGDNPYVRGVARIGERLVLQLDYTAVVLGRSTYSDDYAYAAEEDTGTEGATETSPSEAAEAMEEDADEVELPSAINVEALESSFALVRPRAGELAELFYAKLFAKAPAVREMFPAEMKGMLQALAGSLETIVTNLRKPSALATYLQDLGARHVGYGAAAAHYDVVGGVLLETLAELAGEAWTDELEDAWATAYAMIQDIMITAAASVGEEAAA